MKSLVHYINWDKYRQSEWDLIYLGLFYKIKGMKFSHKNQHIFIISSMISSIIRIGN